MRLAFISDIHGNPIALEAVLADIETKGGVDGYWFLGDYCALGYDPARVLEIITTLPNSMYVRGNTDRYTITGERPRPTVEGVFAEPELMSKFIEVNRSFAWTQGYLTAGDWEYWLEELPVGKTYYIAGLEHGYWAFMHPREQTMVMGLCRQMQMLMSHCSTGMMIV